MKGKDGGQRPWERLARGRGRHGLRVRGPLRAVPTADLSDDSRYRAGWPRSRGPDAGDVRARVQGPGQAEPGELARRLAAPHRREHRDLLPPPPEAGPAAARAHV